MSTNFPTSLDSLTNPQSTDKLNSPSHSGQHTNENDAIEAIEAKIGIDGSTDTTSHSYKLSGVTTGDKAVSLTGNDAITGSKTYAGGTFTAPTIIVNDDSFTLRDNGDTTKKAQFQLSGISGSTTRTFTFPDADTTLLGTDNTATVTNKTHSTGSSIDGSAGENMSFYGLARQALTNGNFDIWQRNTTFTTPNDDTYGPDRWNFLVETSGSWTFSRSTDVPSTKSQYSMKCVNVTLNNQCGFVQILKNADSTKLTGRTVSISFAAKTTTAKTIDNLRATVLSWNSTADSVTSDVVGTWAQNGTDPTWAANWTSEKAGANLALTTSWQTFKVENIAIDTSSTTNVALVIWVDDGTIAANDEFYITQVEMNVGAVALPFQPKPLGEELLLAQEHVELLGSGDFGQALSANQADFAHAFKVRKFSGTITTTILNTAAVITEINISNRTASSGTISVQGSSKNGLYYRLAGFSGMTNLNRCITSSDDFAYAECEI